MITSDLFGFVADGASAAAQRSPGMEMLVMLFLFLGMWFLLIAPQKKRQKKHEQMISQLKNGDRILTSSGIYGEVVGVKNDRFNVKVCDHVVVELHKSFVSTKL